ncbi:MAG: ATP-binding protein [Desulfobulbaceae bacterium]|nr:ATP-binding protein [Desulfobulbaceae bacterium]
MPVLARKIKYIFIVCMFVAIGYPIINVVFVFPLFTDLVIGIAEEDSVRLARHLSTLVVDDNHQLKDVEQIAKSVEGLPAQLGIERLKVYDATGKTIYSPVTSEIGTNHQGDYFLNVVNRGVPYSQMVQRENQTGEGRTVFRDVVESYVPVSFGDDFVGAFEVYFDITARSEKMRRVVLQASAAPVALMFVFLVIVTAILVRIDLASVSEDEPQVEGLFRSPFYFLFVTSLVIFIAELLVMIFFFPGVSRPKLSEALVDASLLVMIIAPVLYFLLGRPLMVHIRQRQEAEKNLIEAGYAAEAANRAKSEFLANMSHEIRTPMNGILGFTSILLSSEVSDKQRNFLEMIKVSANRLMSLINDILDLSKIEAGKFTLYEEPFKLRLSIDNFLSTHKVAAAEKGLHLHWHVADEVPDDLIGDVGRFSQIVNNLVGNSIKFTGSGEIEVRCKLEERGKEDVLLSFSIRDTGIGVSKSRQEAIFETFTQEDGSKTRKYGGSGLGLAICLQLVKMMGGRIWMHNNNEQLQDEGATFCFTVSFRCGKEQSLQHDVVESTMDAIPSDLHILIAEDNYESCILVEELLSRQGWHVTSVKDGREAVEAVEAGGFDLVLMDIQMPAMDGYAAVAAIRAWEKRSGGTGHLPVIAMTAHAMIGDREKCLSAGMNDYISKPVREQELLNIIAKQLQS